MIHDAKIEISCDTCFGSIEYEMPFVYTDYSGNNGHYASNDSDIESFMDNEGWIFDDDNQFCSKDCKESHNQ